MDGAFPIASTVKPKEIFQHEKERFEIVSYHSIFKPNLPYLPT